MEIVITVQQSEDSRPVKEVVHTFEDAQAALHRLERYLDSKKEKEEQRDDNF